MCLHKVSPPDSSGCVRRPHCPAAVCGRVAPERRFHPVSDSLLRHWSAAGTTGADLLLLVGESQANGQHSQSPSDSTWGFPQYDIRGHPRIDGGTQPRKRRRSTLSTIIRPRPRHQGAYKAVQRGYTIDVSMIWNRGTPAALASSACWYDPSPGAVVKTCSRAADQSSRPALLITWVAKVVGLPQNRL